MIPGGSTSMVHMIVVCVGIVVVAACGLAMCVCVYIQRIASYKLKPDARVCVC